MYLIVESFKENPENPTIYENSEVENGKFVFNLKHIPKSIIDPFQTNFLLFRFTYKI